MRYDRVMSDQAPERVPPEFDAFLAAPRNAILCIPRPADAEGPRAPHATPVWFRYEDGCFAVSITRSRVKYRLLQQSPRVTLVIDAHSPYRSVIVEGRATISEDGAALIALSRHLNAKYGDGDPGQTDAALLAALREEGRVVVTITPEKVLSWAY